MHTDIATARATRTMRGAGRPMLLPIRAAITDSEVSAPTITTSPWAKLISPRMPYTMVYPSATRAYTLPSTRPLMIC